MLHIICRIQKTKVKMVYLQLNDGQIIQYAHRSAASRAINYGLRAKYIEIDDISNVNILKPSSKEGREAIICARRQLPVDNA